MCDGERMNVASMTAKLPMYMYPDYSGKKAVPFQYIGIHATCTIRMIANSYRVGLLSY